MASRLLASPISLIFGETRCYHVAMEDAMEVKRLLSLSFAMTLVLAACSGEAVDAPESDAGAAAQSSTPARQPRVIPSGTTLTFETGETLSASSGQVGQTFTARLRDAVVVNGETLIPAGAQAEGRVLEATESGRVSGVASIQLTMTHVTVGGQDVEISTTPFSAQADTSKTEDATKIGVGAGIGAAIGAALGGGGGAAKGAAIGGGAGTAVVLTTRGDDVVLDSGTAIGFTLDQAVELR
jgi:hypothetical protein